MLMSTLTDQGVVVALGDGLEQPFFSVPEQTIIVNGESAHLFTYASPNAGLDNDYAGAGACLGAPGLALGINGYFFIPR